MTTYVKDLTEVSTASAGDMIPVTINGNTRKISLANLAEVIAELITVDDGMVTQRAAPTASPASITVEPTAAGTSMWLLLTPTGTIAVATIELPEDAEDRQEVLVTTTNELTSLTVSAEDEDDNVVGMPSTLAAGAYFRARYDATTLTWYRVG